MTGRGHLTQAHTAGAHTQGHVHLTHKAVPPTPDTLAHTPTHTGLAPASVIGNRPTTSQTNTKPQNLLSVSTLQAGTGLQVTVLLSAPCTTNSKTLPQPLEAAQATD